MVLEGRPSPPPWSSAEDLCLCGISRAGPGRQNLTGPVRCITDPVREAVLIKFGSIIAGFVLWSHYGFFNLVNLSSPFPNPPPLPPTTAGCDLRTIPGIFSVSLSWLSPAPLMGSWRQGRVGKEGKPRIEDVMWRRRPQGLSVQFPHVQHSVWFSEQHKGDSGLIFTLRSPQFRWGGGKTGGT